MPNSFLIAYEWSYLLLTKIRWWDILHPQVFSSYGDGYAGLTEALPSKTKNLYYLWHASTYLMFNKEIFSI